MIYIYIEIDIGIDTDINTDNISIALLYGKSMNLVSYMYKFFLSFKIHPINISFSVPFHYPSFQNSQSFVSVLSLYILMCIIIICIEIFLSIITL